MISENTADVIWLCKFPERRCVYVSPSMRQLRGFSPEEAMAQSMDQWLPPDTCRAIVAEMEARISAL
ncbi:MAG: PAS domain-containing protein, partial [Bryobacteraceae bacterium]